MLRGPSGLVSQHSDRKNKFFEHDGRTCVARAGPCSSRPCRVSIAYTVPTLRREQVSPPATAPRPLGGFFREWVVLVSWRPTGHRAAGRPGGRVHVYQQPRQTQERWDKSPSSLVSVTPFGGQCPFSTAQWDAQALTSATHFSALPRSECQNLSTQQPFFRGSVLHPLPQAQSPITLTIFSRKRIL